MKDRVENFNDHAFKERGFAAQRRYPNEELLRFFGSYYFDLEAVERKKIRVLEVGCGSGANLWMIAREGFDAFGLDLSSEGLDLCKKMLDYWGTTATLTKASMLETGFPDASFEVIVDVFSGYCFDDTDFDRYLNEVTRLLVTKGRYFSYAPSKRNDSFTNPGPSRWIDASTLDGIRRETAPFYGQDYPFHFVEPEEYETRLATRGFSILRNERIGRTYRSRQEYFEFTSIHAQKDT